MSVSSNPNALLELQGVHTHIGAYHILHGVDLTVNRGEVVTRALKAMAEEGLIRKENGAIEILDINKLLELDEAATGRRMFEPPA